MNENLHWKEMCGKSFLSAEDIPEGQDVTLTIKEAGLDDVFDPNTNQTLKKGIIGFQESNLRLVLNKINAHAVATHHGNKTGGWINKKVTLYRTTVKAFGKVLPCVRIRPNEVQ